jgi:hypothetical protein
MTPQLARRREERLVLNLTVKIWGLDSEGKPFAQSAQTHDITRVGARLKPVTCLKKPGEIIGVQYGDEKARYRVVWVGKMGTPTEGMIGLSSVEPEKFIFQSAWPKDRPVASSVAGAAYTTPAATGRRLHRRHICTGGAQVKLEGTSQPRWATVRDISLTGVYLEATEPLAPQSRLETTIKVEEIEFSSRAIVRTSKPGVGMGIAFTEMSVDDRDRLDQLVRMLEEKERGPAAEAAPDHAERQEPSPLLSAQVVMPRAAELAIRMQNANNELRELEKLLAAEREHVDARVVRDFHNAIVHVRQIAWGVQRWLQLKVQDRDPFEVLNQLHAERMRFSSELSKELAMDLEAMELDLTSGDIPAFYNETKRLYKALSRALAKDDDTSKMPAQNGTKRGPGA